MKRQQLRQLDATLSERDKRIQAEADRLHQLSPGIARLEVIEAQMGLREIDPKIIDRPTEQELAWELTVAAAVENFRR
jgi:hypothetical protein